MFGAAPISEPFVDRIAERHQQLAGFDDPDFHCRIGEPISPPHLHRHRIGVGSRFQVRHFVCRIAEGIKQGLLVYAEIGNRLRCMLQPDVGFETKLFGGSRDMLTCATQFPKTSWVQRMVCGSGLTLSDDIEEPLVIAVAGPEHQHVFPEADRPPVAIYRQMVHGKQRHRRRKLHVAAIFVRFNISSRRRMSLFDWHNPKELQVGAPSR